MFSVGDSASQITASSGRQISPATTIARVEPANLEISVAVVDESTACCPVLDEFIKLGYS